MMGLKRTREEDLVPDQPEQPAKLQKFDQPHESRVTAEPSLHQDRAAFFQATSGFTPAASDDGEDHPWKSAVLDPSEVAVNPSYALPSVGSQNAPESIQQTDSLNHDKSWKTNLDYRPHATSSSISSYNGSDQLHCRSSSASSAPSLYASLPMVPSTMMNTEADTMQSMNQGHNGNTTLDVGLPSPIPSPDGEDTTMDSIDGADANMTEDTNEPHESPSSQSTPTQRGAQRTPRVYLGYRSTCEKCRAKVPGHYLHIIR